MVTAELAVAIPTLVLVVVVAVAAVALGIDQVRCVDAARVGVRALARGDIVAAHSLARRAAPAGAAIDLAAGVREVTVDVAVQRTFLGVGRFTLRSSAMAQRERS